MFAACDPVVEEGDFSTATIKDGELLNGLSFAQYEDADCTTPSEMGNYIAFSVPNIPNVTIYQEKPDQSLKMIYRGSSGGVFYFLPARGSEPQQTLVFEYKNMDGSVVRSKKNITIQAALALDPEMALLAGYDEKKVWKWDTDGHVAWGNMGYCGGSGEAVALKGDGQWWGVDFAGQDFSDQQGHRGSDSVTGDDQADSYMVIYDDGNIECYAPEGGDPIRVGSVSVSEYDPNGEWRKGFLNTSAILWPYEINSGGNIPGKYEIVYMTAEKLCLVYPDGGDFGALGGWGEASVWHFKADDPHTLAAGTKLEGKKWAWNTDGLNGGIVWGNMGYCGGDGTRVYTNSEGRWWGVGTTEEFATQKDHRGPDTVTGDDDVDGAYMIITEKEIQSFDKDGKMIRNGDYSFDTSVKNDWKKAHLNITSSNGAILWPYEINSGGNMPSTYEVVYISDDAMSLVYPDGGAFSSLGGWGEASFWHFKSVKE